MMCKPTWLGLAALLLTACTTISVRADIKNWAAGDGSWFVGSNWSPVGVPQATDDVNIVFNDNVARTVTVAANPITALASTVTVDLTGGSNASTLAITGGALNDTSITAGGTGNGAITQSGGTHFTSSNLVLGNVAAGVGTYTLSGGTLESNYAETVGLGGSGTFTQSGGTNFAGNLSIGINPTALGSYNLSGSSSLLQAGFESIGQSATGNGTQLGGSFTQTGGSHQVGQFYMAQDVLSTASYSLSGGALVTQGAEDIAYNGTATFNQTNGSNNTYELDLATGPSGIGSYIISGGGLHANYVNVGGSPYATGGTGVLTINSTANANVDGSLNLYNTPASGVILQGGTLSTPNINVNGVPGLFKWTSGILNITNDVTWDPASVASTTSAIFGSSLNLSSLRTLNVLGNETIGGTGGFQLTLNGGTHTVSGDITLKTGGVLTETSPGSVSLSYINFVQAGGILTSYFRNVGNYTYKSGGFSSLQFTNDGVATFAANCTMTGNLQNNAQVYLTNGTIFSANNGIGNSGAFYMNGATINQSGNGFVNTASGYLDARGAFTTTLTNHGTVNISGVLSTATVTNDGIVEGAGSVLGTGGQFTNSAGGVINANTPGGTLAFTNLVTNAAGGVMNVGPTSTLSVTVNSTTWTNSGVINLQGAGARLTGTTLVNLGVIQGSGTITSPISTSNNNGMFRASGGELDFTASNISLSSTLQLQVTNGATAMFFNGVSNSGTISITGGTFDTNNRPFANSGTINGYGTIRTGSIVNSSGTLLSVGEGNMDVFGNFTNNGVVNIQTGRSAYFYGTVKGSGSFSGGGTAVFLNSLSPGNSPALVTMAGNATLVGGTSLAMELGGTTAGSTYDQLHVGGALSIGGVLGVSLINGFMPAIGSSFDLLDWGTLSGTFSSLSLPSLAAGQWDTSQLYTTGVLSVVPLPGDFDNNGVVDMADYVVWRHGLGTTYTQNDYDVWRTHFGTTSGGGSQLADGQSAAVPEPSLAMLLGAAAAAGFWRRRSRSAAQ